jgi:hypothetical protein
MGSLGAVPCISACSSALLPLPLPLPPPLQALGLLLLPLLPCGLPLLRRLLLLGAPCQPPPGHMALLLEGGLLLLPPATWRLPCLPSGGRALLIQHLLQLGHPGRQRGGSRSS